MAITEELRHRIYQRLEEVLGHDEAAGLMEYLPPVGWADVATKRDLDHLETGLGARIDNIAIRIDNLGDKHRGEWRRDMLQQTYVHVGAMVGIAGVVVSAAKVL